MTTIIATARELTARNDIKAALTLDSLRALVQEADHLGYPGKAAVHAPFVVSDMLWPVHSLTIREG